jgi:hypothetical protein
MSGNTHADLDKVALRLRNQRPVRRQSRISYNGQKTFRSEAFGTFTSEDWTSFV